MNEAETLEEMKKVFRERMAERGQEAARVEYLLFLVEKDATIRNALMSVCELESGR